MGRDTVLSSRHTQSRRLSAGLGVWLAALAVLFQLLLPLAPARAEMTADGVFAPVCAFHDADDAATDNPKTTARQHCPLCQAQILDRLILPSRLPTPAFAAAVADQPWPDMASLASLRVAAVPPLPSRGPPVTA